MAFLLHPLFLRDLSGVNLALCDVTLNTSTILSLSTKPEESYRRLHDLGLLFSSTLLMVCWFMLLLNALNGSLPIRNLLPNFRHFD